MNLKLVTLIIALTFIQTISYSQDQVIGEYALVHYFHSAGKQSITIVYSENEQVDYGSINEITLDKKIYNNWGHVTDALNYMRRNDRNYWDCYN